MATKKTAAKKAAPKTAPKVTAETVANDTAEGKAKAEAAAAATAKDAQTPDPNAVTRAPGGELKGDTGQPAFASSVPTASVHKFLVDGAPGEQEVHQFEGQGAEQQAKDFVEANQDPSWYWTVNTGSRAVQAIPAVDAGAAKGR
jgi:hypothetical protein